MGIYKNYRAWSRSRGTMYKVIGIEEGLYGGLVVEVKDGYFKGTMERVQGEVGKYFVIMEGTGILSVTGEELYESDVVTYTGRYGEQELGEIVKEGRNFYFKSIEVKLRKPVHLKKLKNKCTLRGNIYENWKCLQ